MQNYKEKPQMKKSIAYLPKRKQHDLNRLTKEIITKLPQAEMVILFGSYARDEFVDYDERNEFGIRTSYRSDYDILVVTSGISDKEAGRILDHIDDKYYQDPDIQTPVQFINDDIKTLNRCLEEGRYFYTQIKQEGVVLYDSGRFKLARRRKLNYTEIKQQAEDYYKEKIETAEGFQKGAKFYYDDGNYKLSSFNLHQTAENLIYATRLVFTLENNKQHNLAKLINSVKRYSAKFIEILPRQTAEEKRLFNLIKAAYVEARYNPQFIVAKEDIEALTPKINQLFQLVKEICEKRINEYEEMK